MDNPTGQIIQELRNTLDSSSSVLFVATDNYDSHFVYSFLAFYLAISNKHDDTYIFLDEELSNKTSKMTNSSLLKQYKNSFSNQVTVKFGNIDNDVESLDWAQVGRDLEITITTKKGQLNTQDMQIKHLKREFSAIVKFGKKPIEETHQKLIEENENLLKDTKIIRFEKLLSESTSNEKEGEKIGSTTQRTIELLKKLSLEPQGESATYLLQSLYKETKMYTKNVNPSIFETAAQLLKDGAKIVTPSKTDKTEEGASNKEEKGKKAERKTIKMPTITLSQKKQPKTSVADNQPSANKKKSEPINQKPPTQVPSPVMIDPLAPAAEDIKPLEATDPRVGTQSRQTGGPLPAA